jgi:sulfite exporter TauE/SafE
MTLPLVGGLVMGIASSAHCAAMCGPLVLTIGRRIGPRSRGAQVRHVALYHAGRVLVYLAMAVPAGWLGGALVLGGFSRVLAVGAGLLLLVGAVSSLRRRAFDGITMVFAALLSRVSSPALTWAASHPVAGALTAGAINGLLPCGLVYAAVTAAAATGSPASAALLMTGFGIGTAGVLIAISLSAASLSTSLRLRLRHLSPIVLLVAALVLIVRGVAVPHEHPAPPLTAAAPAHAHGNASRR